MDETPLFMNIPNSKTIAKIGSKEVNVKTHGQERIHVTAKLCIASNSTKLYPMFVFKGKPDGRVDRRLHRNSLVKDKKVFAFCQPLEWNNMTIMKKLIIKVWKKYSHFVLKKDTMLMTDDASMHKIDIVKDKIKECKIKISMIPGGLTWKSSTSRCINQQAIQAWVEEEVY